MVGMDLQDLNSLRSVEELTSYQKEVTSRMAELNVEFTGLPFTEEAREEFAALKDQNEEIKDRVAELEGRLRAIEEANGRESNREVMSFNTSRLARGDDIYDLSSIRGDMFGPDREELRDRALKSVETSSFPAERKRGAEPGYTKEDLREGGAGLLAPR